MRKPDSTKNVSSERTPPAVKYPACTEIANQMVNPRQPSSAGQWARLAVGAGLGLTSSPRAGFAGRARQRSLISREWFIATSDRAGDA